MKLSIPILLAFMLLLAAVSFAHAEAVSANAVSAGEFSTNAQLLSTTRITAQASSTSTITTTGVLTTTDITGVVVYGSGTGLPANLPVTLYSYQSSQTTMELVLTTTAMVGADGTFTFENVAVPEGSIFMTSATYAGVPYHSTPSMGEPMTITVFDVTTATNHLLADQLHVIFSISDNSDLQVIEVYILTNVGVQTIVAGNAGQLLVDFPLPEGAVAPDFRSGVVEDVQLETHDGYLEIPAVRPGGLYGVSYAFSLPYAGKTTLNQPIALPVSSVGVLLPALGSLKVESAGLVDDGPNDFGGATYRVYSGESLRAGDLLTLKISGDPNASPSEAAKRTSGSRLGLVIGLGAFGLVLVLAGVWISRRNRGLSAESQDELVEGEETVFEADETDTSVDADALMDDIIALDDLYQAGDLPEAAYRERRAELKEKLRAIVEDKE